MDLVAELKKIPPVTRVLCLSLFAVTVLPLFEVGTYKDYTYLGLHNWQVWRLYTSLFIGGGGIFWDMALLYQFSKNLETGPYLKQSADLAYQVFWAGLSIILLSLSLHTQGFLRPFLHCLAYVSSALAPEGEQTSFYNFGFSFPRKFLPYVMVVFELMVGGRNLVVLSLPGIVTGYMWWWGVWGAALGPAGAGRERGEREGARRRRRGVLSEYLKAPRWLTMLFREGPPPRQPNPNYNPTYVWPEPQ